MDFARKLTPIVALAATAAAQAQVSDLVTALDAGGRAMGAGGALSLTGVGTLSATTNPAALGFIRRTELGFGGRTLPNSKTIVTGPLNDLRLNTKSETGDFRATHLGFALPLQGHRGDDRGTFGIAVTATGWFHDTQNGANLPNGIATYKDFTRARTDLLSLSYGKASGDAQFAWGVGLVFASQNIRNFQRTTFTDTNIPPQIANSDATGNGIGVQVGVMLTPRSNPNVTLAASARTPIRIRDSAAPLSLYDRVPGRFAAGVAIRRDGLRQNRDFLILGAEIQHFFDGHDSPRIDRNNQTTGHFGAEYNMAQGDGYVPIRVGYAVVPKGGDGFHSRNTVTYGIGYRPSHGNWTIEVNFGKPNSDGRETGIFVTYRFGK